MFHKLHKIIKDAGLPTLGAALALILGALLLVPEVQSGVTGTKKFTRATRETGGRRKMNRTNRSATYVPRYSVQKVTYGPTDIPAPFRRPDYMIMNGETNAVIVKANGEKETIAVPVVEKVKINREGEIEKVVKIRKAETGKPSSVHRVGRKGKERERQKEALKAELDSAESFGKAGEKAGQEKRLGKEGKGGDSMDASETSTNDLKTLMWQTAAPPSGSVHTASSPRRAGSLAKKGNVQRSQDINGSARKIKERNRERQGDNETNIIRRAQHIGSADDKADADN